MVPMPDMYRAVLFDLDGTLLNTLKDIADSVNRILARSGFPQHPVDAYRYFVGDGMENLARRVLPADRRDPETVARTRAAIDAEYTQHEADTTRPYAGIPELLSALADRGIKMTVLSNKPDHSVQSTVAALLGDWHFDVVLGARPSMPIKPDPAGARDIAARLGIPPAQFLYLGDTGTDMKTAGAAGMYPVGALWGFRTADELLAAGAKTLAKEPTDLLKLLG
jgi:phosphoglycolate phosphatase